MGAMVPLIQTGTTEYLAGSSAGSAAPVFLDATHSLTNAGTITAYLPTAVPGARYIINTPNTALCYLTRTGTDTFYGYTAGAPSDTVIQINSYYPWVRFECYVAGKWHVFFPEWNSGVLAADVTTGGVAGVVTLWTVNLPPYLDGSTYRKLTIDAQLIHAGAAGSKSSGFQLNGNTWGSILSSSIEYLTVGTSSYWVLLATNVQATSIGRRVGTTSASAGTYTEFQPSYTLNTNTGINTFTLVANCVDAADLITLKAGAHITLSNSNSGYGC